MSQSNKYISKAVTGGIAIMRDDDLVLSILSPFTAPDKVQSILDKLNKHSGRIHVDVTDPKWKEKHAKSRR